MRKIFYLLIGFLFAAVCGCIFGAVPLRAQDTVLVDRIVAVVNDEIITLYDVNLALKPFADNIKTLGYPPEKEREMLFKVRSDILEQLINEKLTDQEIKRNNISISEEEVDKAIERIKEKRFYTDEDLRTGLSEQGLTMEEYREELKKQILRTKLINREIKSKVVITPEDIKAYYDNHIEQYAGEKKYHLWHIFIKVSPRADNSERRQARVKMDAVSTKLQQGQPFESLANDVKNGLNGLQGGDLGLFRIEELSRQLQAVIKDMQTGDFSPVLDTEFGYQIIYVQKILETPPKPLAEVESEIEEILYREFIDTKFQSWISELRKGSHIKKIK